MSESASESTQLARLAAAMGLTPEEGREALEEARRIMADPQVQHALGVVGALLSDPESREALMSELREPGEREA